MSRKCRLTTKTLFSFLCGITSWPVAADPILGISAGMTYWVPTLTGDMRSGTDSSILNVDSFGFDKQAQNSFSLGLDHPLTLLPKIRYSTSELSFESRSTVASATIFAGQTFAADTTIDTQLDLKHSEITFYYTLIDSWADINLGVVQRSYSGALDIAAQQTDTGDTGDGGDTGGGGDTDGETVSAGPVALTVDTEVTLGYLSTRIPLPISGWALGLTTRYVDFDSKRHSDWDIKLGYRNEELGMHLNLDFGYRKSEINSEQFSDVDTNLYLQGPYASLQVVF